MDGLKSLVVDSAASILTAAYEYGTVSIEAAAFSLAIDSAANNTYFSLVTFRT